MPFNRRLGPALLACALGVTSACHRSHPSKIPAKPVVAASAPTPSSPDQIVRTRAPQSEIAVLNGKVNFSDLVSTPNDVMKDQAQSKKANEWKKVVLRIGRFDKWIGYTKHIDVSGRIEIGLSNGILLFADPPKGSRLLSVVENLDENRQPVLISGAISRSFLDATRLSDDPNFPTCFESRIGPAGCQIDLTSISPVL
jgi:hypothetical protein